MFLEYGLSLLLLLEIGPRIYANSHDHFASLPFAENISAEHESIFQLPTEQQRLVVLYRKDPANLVKFLRLVFPESSTQLDLSAAENEGLRGKRLSSKVMSQEKLLMTMTLTELCSLLGPNRQMVLQKLLQMPTDRRWSPNRSRALYRAAEDLRKNLFQILPKVTILRIFGRFLRQEPMINRARLDVSASSRFFASDQIDKLVDVQKLAQRHNSELRYFFSLQRFELNFAGLNEHSNWHKILDSKILSGIDVVGSMTESSQPNAGEVEAYIHGLTWLFNFTVDSGFDELRIHMFEGAHQGPFYEAFREVVTNYRRTLRIRLGHSTMITRDWAEFLGQHPTIKFSADLNPASAQTLQTGVSVSSLALRYQWLKNAGIKVHFGADGRGLLADSSPQQQEQIITGKLAIGARPNASQVPRPKLPRRVRPMNGDKTCVGALNAG